MSDFNRVILLGRIGNELELKTSAKGKPYVKLSIATHSYRGGDEKVTYWHRVMVFGSQAEICATYLKKGSQVMVEGFLEVRTYADEATGKKISSVSVVARSVQFLGGKRTVDVQPEGAEVEEGEHEGVALAESA